MGMKRPFKVRYHFDGTKRFSDDATMPNAYIIDTSRPIDGLSSHADLDTAEAAARRVSRNGGSAEIMLRDNINGTDTMINGYAPYEMALEELNGGETAA